MSSTKKIEQLIGLYFSNGLSAVQQLELARLTDGLTDEQLQAFLEKAWASYLPATDMPDIASGEILASIFNSVDAAHAEELLGTVAGDDILLPIQQNKFSETINAGLMSTVGNTGIAAGAVTMNDNGYKNKKNILRIILALSASVAAVILLFIFYGNGGSSENKEMWKTFESAYGERKNFQLPDGSVVTLNSGSKITIDQAYGITARDIFLEGEAFFDVKHNKEIPFIVHTAAMDVRAVGTAFDVKAYPGEKLTETSLIRGVVEVTLKEERQRKLTLQPNQKVQSKMPEIAHGSAGGEKHKDESNSVQEESKVQDITKTDEGDIKETAWKENKLVFADESFADIAILLERWYGVKMVFEDDTIRNYRFTGTFEKEELGSVLNILKESRHFNYVTITGQPIKVKLYK